MKIELIILRLEEKIKELRATDFPIPGDLNARIIAFENKKNFEQLDHVGQLHLRLEFEGLRDDLKQFQKNIKRRKIKPHPVSTSSAPKPKPEITSPPSVIILPYEEDEIINKKDEVFTPANLPMILPNMQIEEQADDYHATNEFHPTNELPTTNEPRANELPTTNEPRAANELPIANENGSPHVAQRNAGINTNEPLSMLSTKLTHYMNEFSTLKSDNLYIKSLCKEMYDKLNRLYQILNDETQSISTRVTLFTNGELDKIFRDGRFAIHNMKGRIRMTIDAVFFEYDQDKVEIDKIIVVLKGEGIECQQTSG